MVLCYVFLFFAVKTELLFLVNILAKPKTDNKIILLRMINYIHIVKSTFFGHSDTWKQILFNCDHLVQLNLGHCN